MKIIRRIMSIVLAVAMIMPTSAAALENSDSSSDVFIQTRACPLDIIEYASENAARLVQSMDENHDLNYDGLYVGCPFTYGEDMSNLFTFPIINNGRVIYTLRVAYTPEGEICGTASAFLVDFLNSYRGKTSVNNPILFKVSGCELQAYLGNSCETVYVFPEDEMEAVMTSNSLLGNRNNCLLETVNISEAENIDLHRASTRDPMKYINLSLSEYQPSGNNWCAAYVTAAIISTVTGGHYEARYISNHYHRYGQLSYFSIKECAEYAQDIAGLSSTNYTSYGLSGPEIMQQIDDNMPIYYGMTCNAGGHAFALRGYSMNNMTWSVWDPRNSSFIYEAIPMEGNYVSSTGVVWVPNGNIIYDFKP